MRNTSYRIQIERDNGWYVGRVLEREGVTTQGRSLDELVFMLRDAIELMWNERDVQLELIVPSLAKIGKRKAPTRRGSRPVRVAASCLGPSSHGRDKLA